MRSDWLLRSGMTRWLSISALILAGSIAIGAQSPRPVGSLHAVHAAQRPERHPARDHSVPVVSVNVWYHVGSANERPGRTGFAHLFEHLMFEGSMHVPEGRVRHAARGRRRQQQRLDHQRSHQLLRSTCRRTRSSSRCSSSRIAWATCSTTRRRTRRRPARRREERAAPERREPAVRHGVRRAATML